MIYLFSKSFWWQSWNDCFVVIGDIFWYCKTFSAVTVQVATFILWRLSYNADLIVRPVVFIFNTNKWKRTIHSRILTSSTASSDWGGLEKCHQMHITHTCKFLTLRSDCLGRGSTSYILTFQLPWIWTWWFHGCGAYIPLLTALIEGVGREGGRGTGSYVNLGSRWEGKQKSSESVSRHVGHGLSSSSSSFRQQQLDLALPPAAPRHLEGQLTPWHISVLLPFKGWSYVIFDEKIGKNISLSCTSLPVYLALPARTTHI